jgi:hypothetical protein
MNKTLEQLVTELHSTESKTEVVFKSIAEVLMNKMCIAVGSKKYRIAECEFYYDDNHTYQDPFLYCNKNKREDKYPELKQKQRLQWFFHYSGLDITIGNGDNIYGGILIRSLQCVDDNTYIAGPLKSVNTLLNDAHNSITNDKSIMTLVELHKDQFYKIAPHQTTRIGLDKTKIATDSVEKYHQKECRFIQEGFRIYQENGIKAYHNRVNKLTYSPQ